LKRGKEREKFIQFLEHIEYEEGGVPRPDLVVYLDVPTQIAQKLIAQKGVQKYMKGKGTHDQYEKDKKYQKEVSTVYLDLAQTRPDWVRVDLTKKGEMQSKEENHKQILKVVEEFLK
jgi:dTMP kinase